MKVSLQRILCALKLSRKGTVIDFDLIISYVIFISTIIILITFALKMTSPFATSIETINKEKSTIAVQGLISNQFNVNNLDSICDVDYVNLRRLTVTYEIKGFNMPFIDDNNFLPNSINGSVVFKRDGSELHVLTGSSYQLKNIIVKVIFSGSASVTNISLESNDSFSVSYNSFNDLVVSLNSTVSDNDVDELIIKPINGLVSFQINGVNVNDCFIGNLSISNYCGVKGIRGSHTSFNRYGLITDNRTSYPVKLRGDIWWTD